jgi:adenylate cyclase
MSRPQCLLEQPIGLRIGIHTGPLVVGNIGAPGRINYTVVGDTVNVAQRLEGLGKQVDAEAEVVTLLSAETASQLSGEFILQNEGDFQLRGKQQDVSVLRLGV